MTSLFSELLASWCQALLRHQVMDIQTPGIHGGILCPACSRIHGRCFEALLPLMYLADNTSEVQYLTAAKRLFRWSDHVTSPDGSWLNDPVFPPWKGTTVFGSIALAEALRHHGRMLDAQTRRQWLDRLRKAAGFLYAHIDLETGYINYPFSSTYAFALCGMLLHDTRLEEKARHIAEEVKHYFTPNNAFVFGEGKPKDHVTAHGCYPVDLGYNVEETLQNFALYGLLVHDEEVLDMVTQSFKTHLAFILPDGAWDNSWGTRSYKWTYWGSSTADGCQPALVLLGDRDPAFLEAAWRNTKLLARCTHDGILHGGPHFHAHGERPCIHHTFCHAKGLAIALQHMEAASQTSAPVSLPRNEAPPGMQVMQDIRTWIVRHGPWRATVTANDWEIRPATHPSGGAMSLLWHEDAGPIVAASMTEYHAVEPHNMPHHQSGSVHALTPRIEWEHDGTRYRSIHDHDAVLSGHERANDTIVEARGRLKDVHQREPAAGSIAYDIRYAFAKHATRLSIALDNPKAHAIRFYLPILSDRTESVQSIRHGDLRIRKADRILRITSNMPFAPPDAGQTRIFNPVPGFEALVLCYAFPQGTWTLEIRIQASAHG